MNDPFKILRNIIYCGIVLLIIWMVIDFSPLGRRIRNSTISKHISELRFSGIVDSVGFDQMDHNSPKIYLKGETKIDLSFVLNHSEIMDLSHPGDKISKQKGSFIIIIHHSDSLTVNIKMKVVR